MARWFVVSRQEFLKQLTWCIGMTARVNLAVINSLAQIYVLADLGL